MSSVKPISTRTRIGIACAGMLAIFFLVSVGATNLIGPEVTRLANWIVNEGWHGQIVFVAVLAAACVTGIIPASMLVIGAGTVYGLVTGMLLSMIGLAAGSIMGFFAARFLFRDIFRVWVSRRPSFRTIDADIAEKGWKVVVLLRLSPVAPFAITSYAFGLSRIAFIHYLIGTIGSLPALVAYVYMGVLAGEALRSSAGAMISWVRLGLLGLGVAATIIAGVYFYRILRPSEVKEELSRPAD